ALVRAATHWAAVDDAKVVSAGVVDDEEPAIALFEGSGFLPTGERVRIPRNPERYETRWTLTLANDEGVQQRKVRSARRGRFVPRRTGRGSARGRARRGRSRPQDR